MLHHFLTYLRKTLDFVCCLLLAFILIIIIIGIYFRYVMNSALYWSDALSVNLFTWMGFLGVILSVRNRSMFGVEIFVDRFNLAFQKWWKYFIHLVELLIFVLVFIEGIRFTEMQWGMILSAFPQWFPIVNAGWVYLAIPVFSLLASVELLMQLFNEKKMSS